MFHFNDQNTVNIQELTGTVVFLLSADSETLNSYKALGNVCKNAEFKLDEAEKSITLYGVPEFAAQKMIVASIGEGSDRQKSENTGGQVFGELFRGKEQSVSLIIDKSVTPQDALDFIMGASLKCYQFDQYKTTLEDKEKATLDHVNVYSHNTETLEKGYDEIIPVISGVFTTRDLVCEPANILNPETYAERCQELEAIGLEVTVLSEQEMADLNMYSLLGVGQGSPIESKLVIMKWKGNKSDENYPISLVGKGVCFDAGGISLKPGNGMWDMIFDMGGSASVVGTMVTLANRKAPINVIGVIGLVENMPDGNAQRPGDVVKTANGQTVEVLNTDAEGRLVLADALWYVQKFYQPKTIIDLATLTGAIISALGYEYAGLFTNNTDLQSALQKAAEATGDKVWPMPLDSSMKKRLKSRVADIANIASTPEAGSSTAACFLQHFINDDVSWAHLDIAGTVWTKEAKPTCPKGGTGWGVRILNAYIKSLEA